MDSKAADSGNKRILRQIVLDKSTKGMTKNAGFDAVEVDQVLTILIKAEVREEKGEEMLCLSIEDDGGGYPQEVLENFLYETGERHEKPQNGERIGLISIKRMLELMYERDDLFEIGNTVPHGCCNYFWIPKQPIQEIKES